MKRVSTSVFVLVIVALAACSQAASPNSVPTATTAVEPTAQPTAPATPRPTKAPAPIGSLLDSVLEGLGGRGPLDTLSNFVIDATVMRGATGEGPQPVFEPDAPFTLSMLLTYDVEGDSLRLDYVRGEPAPATYNEVIAGNLGYMEGTDSRFGNSEGSNIASDRLASSRKQQRLLNPLLIIREAAADPALVSDGGTAELDGVQHDLLVIEDDTFPITLFVNPQTGTISKLATMENDHWLRDVTLEVIYADWQPTDTGLMFPNEVSMAVEGQTIHMESRHMVQTNASLDAALFQFPEGADPAFEADLAVIGERTSQSIQLFAARGFPQPVLQTTVDGQEVAPGVFHLRGSSHNSLVVVQENGIVIAEAPLYPERSEAVMAWVGDNFPNKPITHVISSHHHRDHSSGLRTYVAGDVTVVMSELALETFEEIFDRPSAILPDALAENPAEPTIEAVPAGGTLEIPDSERSVIIGSISPGHASDTVFTYVAGVVFMGDGGAQTPELRTALEDMALTASIFAGGHGQAGPIE